MFIIPMLTAALSVKFPLADYIENFKNRHKSSDTYKGTEYSFFYTDDPEQAQKDFEDIAYYFDDVDWLNEIIYPVVRTAANPGEAAEVLKKELHIDLSDFNIDINQLYQDANAD
jgi:hypothetical protein